jgi:hypothetical protein
MASSVAAARRHPSSVLSAGMSDTVMYSRPTPCAHAMLSASRGPASSSNLKCALLTVRPASLMTARMAAGAIGASGAKPSRGAGLA